MLRSVDWLLTMFRDKLSVPSQRVKQFHLQVVSKRRWQTIKLRCVTSKKIEYFIYIAEEVSQHWNVLLVNMHMWTVLLVNMRVWTVLLVNMRVWTALLVNMRVW
jgi:hypothetical protein